MSGLKAPLPGSVYAAFDRAARSLFEAASRRRADERYVTAHVAALQVTAALLAALAKPSPRGRPTSAWVLLDRVAPEFADWATYFSAGAGKRAAAESGLPHAVTAREADDLLRASEQFFAEAARRLDLEPAVLLGSTGYLTSGLQDAS
jgi:hypothetical protein